MSMVVRPDGVRLSLSVVEKFLRRRDWSVTQWADPRTGLLLARAESPDGLALSYPDPHLLFPDRDREADLDVLLEALSRALGQPRPELDQLVLATFDRLPATFACHACGTCCTRLGDAAHGRVSPEEIEMWRAAGRERILRFIGREERRGYVFFPAWVHPRTGDYLKKCPWLVKEPGTSRHLCAIHDLRPLKCRSFPLDEAQASRIECPGLIIPSI